jgi:thioredoxin reductase (NADPH)
MLDYFDASTIEDYYDLVIIGGGPAGCVAALYASRDRLKTLVVEKVNPGGMMSLTSEVENHPGFPEAVSGIELSLAYHTHAKKNGAAFKNASCTGLGMDGDMKLVFLEGRPEPVQAKTIIIATGSAPRKLNVPGEVKYWGRGVSACGTCDGGFFKDKVVAAIGGGNTALEESDYLTRFASKVYLIHRRKEFRGDLTLQRLVTSNPKIELVLDSVVMGIFGGNTISSIQVKNVLTGKEQTLGVEGVFVFVGQKPAVEPFADLFDKNEEGFILADETTKTKMPGVFVAGDVRAKPLRQIATAVSDGAVAAKMAVKHIQEINAIHA